MVSVRIPLTCGKFARVSIEDAERIRARKWHIVKGRTTDYAASGCGKSYTTLHRFVLIGISLDVDHRNHDGLDNRRSNIREATNSQNKANSRLHRNNTSGYKGVSRAPAKAKAKPWRARIMVDGVPLALGCHATELDAARAYNAAALHYFGEYAYINQIGGE